MDPHPSELRAIAQIFGEHEKTSRFSGSRRQKRVPIGSATGRRVGERSSHRGRGRRDTREELQPISCLGGGILRGNNALAGYGRVEFGYGLQSEATIEMDGAPDDLLGKGMPNARRPIDRVNEYICI